MTCLPETLNCGDSRLRPMRETDLVTIRDQLNHFDTCEWLAAINHPFEANDAEELFQSSMEPERNVRVIEKNGQPIGCVSIGTTMWYWLAPEFCGQGIMYRVLQKGICALFAKTYPPLTAVCRQDNLASIALLTKLGFSRARDPKRLFFRAAKRSALCFEYVMTAEQWHYLNPPYHVRAKFMLRAATTKDVPKIAVLQTSDWGTEARNLPAFIERHRYRGPGYGLFVIDDAFGTPMGLALMNAGEVSLLFAPGADPDDLEPEILDVMQNLSAESAATSLV